LRGPIYIGAKQSHVNSSGFGRVISNHPSPDPFPDREGEKKVRRVGVAPFLKTSSNILKKSLRAVDEEIPCIRMVAIASALARTRNDGRKSPLISLLQKGEAQHNRVGNSLKGSNGNCFSLRYLKVGFRKGRKPLPK
jgi:hypothetical protein